MQLFHHYHTQQFAKRTHSDFWLFEFSVWLHVVALSLISVFIPILLLKTGFLLSEVLLYYVFFYAFNVPLNAFARWIVLRAGARVSIVLGTLSVIAFFFCLAAIAAGNWTLLITMAFLAAFYDSTYWVGHLFLFMKVKQGGESSQTGIFYFVRQLASLLGPAIGAGILIFVSKDWLIWFSIVFFFLSIVPLLHMHKLDALTTHAHMKVKDFFKDGINTRNMITLALWNIHGASEGLLWPMFIYITFETLESVALVPIIVSVTAILFSYLSGNLKGSKRIKSIMLAALFIALIWLARLVFDAPIFLYVSVALVGFFAIFVTVPLDSNILDRGSMQDPLMASTLRNTVGMGTKFFLFAGLYLAVNVFNVAFTTALLFLLALVFFNEWLVMHLHQESKKTR